MPSEYLCLVGGPCNTFNGYMYVGNDDVEACDPPLSHAAGEIVRYLKGPLDTSKRSVRYPFGEPKYKTFTHDRYWGNFLLAALRLYMHRHVSPQPGDTITLLVYLRPFVLREIVDWNASPYNGLNGGAAGVAESAGGGAGDISDFTEGLTRWSQWCLLHPYCVRAYASPLPEPRVRVSRDEERRINHQILARTTSRTRGVPLYDKRPTQHDSYLHLLYFNCPEYLIWGLGGERKGSSPIHKEVMARLLFFSKWSEVERYILTGRWNGRLQRTATTVNCFYGEEAEKALGPWRYARLFPKPALHYPKTNWVYCREPAVFPRFPGVDRSKVKISRFDYFGHSGPDGLYLDYGWLNYKGELPDFVYTSIDVLEFVRLWKAAHSRNVLDKSAAAKLWGCSMAYPIPPPHSSASIAERLKGFFATVIASAEAVDYEAILDSDTNMPTSTWKEFRP